MLERLFTSGTRIRILSHLMFHQDSVFHLRELARLIQGSPIHVAHELDNLLMLNLVKKDRRGNLNLYSINRDCVILPELRQIFLKTDYLGQLISQHLKDNVQYAFIYGSFARGEESESSDIDLFVVGDIKEDRLIRVIQQLEKETGREINYVLWNGKTFRERLTHPLLKKIKKDNIIMIHGDEHELKSLIR